MSRINDQDRIRIDGSYGQGGGQILRTSLSLSCALRRPVEIVNIRRERSRPGLQPQHLTAVKAAAVISNARVEGADLSSSRVLFTPGTVIGGDYRLDVAEMRGSAGSSSLVLQTIILPLCFASEPANITVLGGTHVPWSPSFHYLKRVFLPFLSHIDVRLNAYIEKWGWYPQGGGKVAVRITPPGKLTPFILTERGRLVNVSVTSAVSNLPREIALRQRNAAVKALWEKGVDTDIEVIQAPSPGKGTAVMLCAEFEHVVAGFEALGAPGKPAETVAEEACHDLLTFLDSTGAVDPNLADQIVPYLALAEGESSFTTSRVTGHLLTNLWVVKQFTGAAVRVDGREGEEGRITIAGVAPKRA